MSWDKIKEFFTTLTLERLLPVALILLGGAIIVKLLLRLFDRMLTRSKMEQTMFKFLRALMRVLLYTLVILIAAGSLGIDVSSLVAVLSVASLAVTLAVQNVLENLIGGVTLLATHPYRVGDFIEVGTDSGTVEEIGLHYTAILTVDGKRIFIPNSDASTARICNFSVAGKRRVDLKVKASYEDDPEKVKQTLMEAAQSVEILEGTEPVVGMNELGESGVEYLLMLWCDGGAYLTTKFALTERIKILFAQRGITIPYPQVDVHTK